MPFQLKCPSWYCCDSPWKKINFSKTVNTGQVSALKCIYGVTYSYKKATFTSLLITHKGT